jgi:hypothetical protein
MSVLVDTNILTRAAQPGHRMHNSAVGAVDNLRSRGDELCVVPQKLIEFGQLQPDRSAQGSRNENSRGPGLTR